MRRSFNLLWGGVLLKYFYEQNKSSKDLVVVFSACTRKGIKARYNYVRTLKKIKKNKLFILDDFAEDHRGAYYLGKNCGNEIELACKELIEQKAEIIGAEKIILCGSSKGGWAALNLMTDIDGSIAVVGAPQYKLGNYLMGTALQVCRSYVMPETTEGNIDFLNNYLSRKLNSANPLRHYVYLHYSDSEHTYQDHIIHLLADLKRDGYGMEIDCKHYTDHWDVSKFFPDFLCYSIEKI